MLQGQTGYRGEGRNAVRTVWPSRYALPLWRRVATVRFHITFVAASEFSPISWNLSVPRTLQHCCNPGTSVVITLIPSQVKVGDVITVIAVDSNSKIVTATIARSTT